MSDIQAISIAPAAPSQRAATPAASKGDTTADPGADQGSPSFGALLGAGIERQGQGTGQTKAAPSSETRADETEKASASDPAAILSTLAPAQPIVAAIVAAVTPAGVRTAGTAEEGNARATAAISVLGSAQPGAGVAGSGARDPALGAKEGPSLGAKEAPALGAKDAAKDGAGKATRPSGVDASPTPRAELNTVPAAVAATAERATAPELRVERTDVPAQVQALSQLAHAPQALQPLPGPAARIEQLPQPVGTPAWQEGLSSHVVWMAKGDIQKAEIRLNPADLGPIDVTLKLSGEHNNQASVQFSAAHATTREALEAALPRLREMMQESGISLGQAGVDARHSGGTTADPGQQQRQGGSQGWASGQSADAPAASLLSPAPRRGGNGLVDTFA